MVYKCLVLSVEMQLFVLCIMILALAIYLKLNLAVITVLHFLNPNYLQIYLLLITTLREIVLIQDSIFALSNVKYEYKC